MDLRKEAENRVRQKSMENEKLQNAIQKFRSSARSKAPLPKQFHDSTLTEQNKTPEAARLAAVDYKLNGSRARANSGEFLMPRWIPNDETTTCQKCKLQFDLTNRRHHCRHCGLLVCQECSKYSLLLPQHFGFRDPQRVCSECNDTLKPIQVYLSNNIANHLRTNNIDVISSDSCTVRRYFNLPYSGTLGSEIRKAAYSTHNLFVLKVIRDKMIPLRLLQQAKGLVYLTVIKAGFGMFAPRLGTGLVIARLDDDSTPHYQHTSHQSVNAINRDFDIEGPCDNNTNNESNNSFTGGGIRWSAPSAIATAGVGWGLVAGLDVTDYVIILNTSEAVRAFSGAGQVTVGAGIDIAVGPVGRSTCAEYHVSSNLEHAPAYSYSHSRGLFAGVSLDGAVIATRKGVNHTFYGRPVTAGEILDGTIPPPRAADALYSALSDALASTPYVQHSVRPVLTPPRKHYLTEEQRKFQEQEQQQLGSRLFDSEQETQHSKHHVEDLSDALSCGLQDVDSDDDDTSRTPKSTPSRTQINSSNKNQRHGSISSTLKSPGILQSLAQDATSLLDTLLLSSSSGKYAYSHNATTYQTSTVSDNSDTQQERPTESSPKLSPQPTFKNEVHFSDSPVSSGHQTPSPLRSIAAEVNSDNSFGSSGFGSVKSNGSAGGGGGGGDRHLISSVFNDRNQTRFDLDNMCYHVDILSDESGDVNYNAYLNRNQNGCSNSSTLSSLPVVDNLHSWFTSPQFADDHNISDDYKGEEEEEEGEWVQQNPQRSAPSGLLNSNKMNTHRRTPPSRNSRLRFEESPTSTPPLKPTLHTIVEKKITGQQQRLYESNQQISDVRSGNGEGNEEQKSNHDIYHLTMSQKSCNNQQPDEQMQHEENPQPTSQELENMLFSI